jgi:uncharacterized integral membrane protein
MRLEESPMDNFIQKLETRTILIMSLALVVLIIVLQNLGETTFQVLFLAINMPRIIFYLVLVLVGFLLGYQFAKRK